MDTYLEMFKILCLVGEDKNCSIFNNELSGDKMY